MYKKTQRQKHVNYGIGGSKHVMCDTSGLKHVVCGTSAMKCTSLTAIRAHLRWLVATLKFVHGRLSLELEAQDSDCSMREASQQLSCQANILA